MMEIKLYLKKEKKLIKRLKRELEIIRYEKEMAWELVHIDLHKRKNIKWENPKKKKYMAWIIDDATRLQYWEVLSDKKAKTLAGFIKIAYAWFKKNWITIKKLMSDNWLEFSTHHKLSEEIAIITEKGTKKAVKEILNEYKNTPEDLTNAIQGLFYFTANSITNPSDTIDDSIKKLEKAEDTVKMLASEMGEIAKNIPQLIEGMSQKDKIYYTAYITTHLAHEFAPTSKLKLLKLTKLDKFKRPL